MAGRIVAQGRYQLQDGGAGERARGPGADTVALLLSGPGCGDKGGRTVFLANLSEVRMSEPRLTSLTVESPPPERIIVVRVREGKSFSSGPGLFWLGGFKSDMKGTKAEALDQWAAAQGRACIRFDYSAHGELGGDFLDGSIGRWLAESLAVYTRFARGPQAAVGSSMGGWLALLMAQALREVAGAAPIAGMVLIAPAVDFTEELLWKQLADPIKREIEEKGVWLWPSDYDEGEPYPITKRLIQEVASISCSAG